MTKDFVNNKPVFHRKLTLLSMFYSFLLGFRVIIHMLVGVRNGCSGLTLCNVIKTAL